MKLTSDSHPHEFDEYLRQSEPHRRERAESWKTAIGLQAVDGLKPSAYLFKTAKRHIEGDITIDEVKGLIDSYYQSKASRKPVDDQTEEADKVSANITRLLNEKTFTFSPMGYLSIHRRIFEGVFKFAGQLRDYNITKKEWVLRGDTVLYASAQELLPTLEYDFKQESAFEYKGLEPLEVVVHIVRFISGLWQIHAFAEGNTRTTAVFVIKYLRSMGFNVNNDLFAEHSWYFRNALVRANYRNYQKGIEPDSQYLERFFRNLLLGEQNELKNRFLLTQLPDEWCAEPQVKDQYPTSTRQAQSKHPTSTQQLIGRQSLSTIQSQGKDPTSSEQTPDKLETAHSHLLALILALGHGPLSRKELLAALGLKDRESFVHSYLTPALQSGFVRMLYPQSPRHPQQKYLLTAKGMALYQKEKDR